MAPRRRRTGPGAITPQSRPNAEGLPPPTPPTVHVPGDVPRDVPGDMRRRREAAHRLPPLASGYRDPLDQLAGLPITRADCCRGMFSDGGKWQQCCGR
jgi:hypothetical protein